MAEKRKVANLMALAVLATIVARPMHRYEMASVMRARGKDRDMDIKWGSLYTVVQNLEKHGLVEATEAAFGKLDILVNNAGLASVHSPEQPNPLIAMTDDEWSLALRRNLDSAFYVTRAALPGMVERGYGRIVNVASTAGILTAYTGDVGYHTAKAAMLGMTRSVAVDYAATGITCNVVLPGWIATAAQLPSEVAQGNATPVGRSATAAEVATGIAFLAAPGASYVTGTTLVIDGGNAID